MIIDFTPELVAGVVGMVISWVFAWFPSLRTWYASLKTEIKSGIMLLMLALTTVIIYILAQNGVLQTTEPITRWRLLSIFFAASTINQTAYKLTPEAHDVTGAKKSRMANG